jgi:hypothetical protein
VKESGREREKIESIERGRKRVRLDRERKGDRKGAE